jgi:hypothetical protein
MLVTIRETRFAATRALGAVLALCFMLPNCAWAWASEGCPYTVAVHVNEPIHRGTSQQFTISVKALPGQATIPQPLIITFERQELFEITDLEDHPQKDHEFKPGDTATFKIKLDPENSGLLELALSSKPYDACEQSRPLDTDFQGIVALGQPKGESKAEQTDNGEVGIDAAAIKPFTTGRFHFDLQFTRKATGDPLTFAVSPTVEFTVDGNDRTVSQFGDSKGKPSGNLVLTATGGNLPEIEVGGNHWGDEGTILVRVLESPNSPEIKHFNLNYRVAYPAWLLLIATVLGALAYAAVESLPILNRPAKGQAGPPWWQSIKKDGYETPITVAVVAILVFTLKDFPLLKDVKLDASSFRSYFLYGLIAAIVGLEGVWENVKKLLGGK